MQSHGGLLEDFLHRRRVSERTEAAYLDKYRDLLRDFPILQSDLLSAAEVDRVLDQHLHDMFIRGHSIHEARYALYATCWARVLAARQLPRAQRALQGFRRLDPESMRDPVPWDAVLLVAARLCQNPVTAHDVIVGVAMLFNFDSYARPGSLLQLRVDSLVPPVKGVGTDAPKWALIFFPSTENQRSKTFTQDDTVIVGVQPERAFLNNVLSSWVRKLLKHSRLFPISHAFYAKRIRETSVLLGLSYLHFVPHMLRHGGASLDALNGIDLRDIQRRGQWITRESVNRYSKHGRYLRQLQRMTFASRSDARLAFTWLTKNLAKLVANYDFSVFPP